MNLIGKDDDDDDVLFIIMIIAIFAADIVGIAIIIVVAVVVVAVVGFAYLSAPSLCAVFVFSGLLISLLRFLLLLHRNTKQLKNNNIKKKTETKNLKICWDVDFFRIFSLYFFNLEF